MNSMRHLHRTGPALALALLLSSCALTDDQAEPPPEEKESFVPYSWVSATLEHRIVLRLVEEEDGELEIWTPEDEERMSDVDTLIAVGMLEETDDGFTIVSDAELDQLPGDPGVSPSMLSSAMESLLNQNDVRWCGEPVRGMDFRDTYLNRYNKYDEQPYDTQEEFLESIEDYVDCGTG